MTQNSIFLREHNPKMRQEINGKRYTSNKLLNKIALGEKKIESNQGLALKRLLTRLVKNGKSIETPGRLVEIALVITGDAGNLDIVKHAIANAQKASRDNHGQK